jgi:hypothetical protein
LHDILILTPHGGAAAHASIQSAAELAFIYEKNQQVRAFGLLNGLLWSDGATTLVLANHAVSLGCIWDQTGWLVDAQTATAASVSTHIPSVAQVSVDGIELSPEEFKVAGETLTVRVTAGTHQFRLTAR